MTSTPMPSAAHPRAKRYRFEARIESAGAGGARVLFPYDVEKEFGTRGRVPVSALIAGVPYKGSLVKYGAPQHMLPLLKAIRNEIDKQPGDTVAIELWRDEAPRELETPPNFARAMKQAKVFDYFASLSYTHRKEYIRWITEAKKEETRLRRFDKAIEMLRSKIKTPDGAAARS